MGLAEALIACRQGRICEICGAEMQDYREFKKWIYLGRKAD